jgi:mono/diheme cytochrome c family protein
MFNVSISLIALLAFGLVSTGCGGTSEKELSKSEARTKAQEKMLNPEAAAEEEAEEKAKETKAEESPDKKTDTKAEESQDKKAEEKTDEKAEEKAEGDAKNGKGLFVTSCGACHALADAGTSGAVGPKIDGLGWDYEKVLTQIKNGKGAMPPNTATGSDAEDIAAYVAEVAK